MMEVPALMYVLDVRRSAVGQYQPAVRQNPLRL